MMASIKETRDAIKALPGMTALHADGEWRVTINLYRLSERYPDKNTAWCEEKQEEMAYYTTDAEDALATAKKMSEAWVAEAQRDVSADARQVNDAGLTKPQQEALDAFREAKGRNWKSAPRANWERASYPGVSADHAAALQQVRNTLGPEWLTKYRAPEPEAPEQRTIDPLAERDYFPEPSASWEAGREAKTLDDAKELAGVALAKLGLPEPTWRPSAGSVAPWEYADVEVGGREKLVVGASSGGVVSVSGDPFTPEKRETNVTLARVMEALEPRINSLRATVTEEAKTEVVGALMKSLEGWGETSRRHENTLLGERIIVLDKHERAFSQTVNNGEPAIQLKLPSPDLNGVSFMTPESAKKVCDHLAERWPDV